MSKLHAVFLLVAIICTISTAIGSINVALKSRSPNYHLSESSRDIRDEVLPDARVYWNTGPMPGSGSSVPLYGGISSYGTYFTEVVVAGQPFNVIVDTGSSILYIPSTACTLVSGPDAGSPCFTANPPLDLSNPQLEPLPCTSTGCTCSVDDKCFMSTLFGDGSSVSGFGYNTTISVGNLTATEASFAAQNAASAGFVNDRGTSIDGLWGMASQRYPDDVIVTIPTFLDALFQEENLTREFSLRLDHTGGELTIGGFRSENVVGPIQYTPRIGTGWYIVNNPRFLAGTTSTSLSEYTLSDLPDGLTSIVDSGATLLTLPESYWNTMQNAMKDVAGCPKYMCDGPTIFDSRRYCYTDFPFDEYPYIGFLLPASVNQTSSDPSVPVSTASTVQLTLGPRQYMILTQDTAGRSCYAFAVAKTTGNFLIFGDTVMTQYYTIFDVGGSKIGFSSRNDTPTTPFAPTGSLSAGSSLAQYHGSVLSLLAWILAISSFGLICSL